MSWIPGRAHLPAGAEMPGPGMGGGSAQFSLPPVSPSPASARSGGNLRRGFMVSGGILLSSAGRGGQRRPGFPTEVASGVGGWPGRVARRHNRNARDGQCWNRRRENAGVPGGRCGAAGGRVSLNSSNHDCLAFPRRLTTSGWAGICAVGFMVSGGRGPIPSRRRGSLALAGISDGSRGRGWRMAGRRFRHSRRGNAAGPGGRCDAAGSRVSSIHLIVKCRAFPHRPTPSGWMMVCVVGFMVSGGRGRDFGRVRRPSGCRDFRRKSVPGLADSRGGWPGGRVAAADAAGGRISSIHLIVKCQALRPSPASARLGGNLRCGFMVSGGKGARFRRGGCRRMAGGRIWHGATVVGRLPAGQPVSGGGRCIPGLAIAGLRG